MESGTLVKLKIVGYKDADGTKKTGNEFVAQVNPSNISINHSVQFTEKEGVDNAVSELKFQKAPPQDINLVFTLDGTGALGDTKPVNDRIEQLKQTAYYYSGDAHEPPFVKISWNGANYIRYDKNEFTARLSSLKVDYTLFKPNGTPLRAKVSVSFKSTTSVNTANKAQGKSSPDLTHHITVKAGDNLPQMCKRIYGDTSYYNQIAEINNLANFRYLEPGSELVFPPLK